MSADLLESDRGVRAAIYRAFRDRVPTVASVAAEQSMADAEVAAAFHRLAAAHALVLTPGTDEIWMAHPFSGIETEYAVDTPEGRYFGNCAWDALSLPSLLGLPAQSEQTCPESGDRLAWSVDAGGNLDADSTTALHFLVPARNFWDDIGFT